MASGQVTLEAQVHREEGMYWAEVAGHPGLFASGATLDELKEALVEAWLLYTQDHIASAHVETISRRQRPKKARPTTPPSEGSGQVDQLRLLVPA